MQPEQSACRRDVALTPCTGAQLIRGCWRASASAGSGAYAALIAAAQKVEHHEIAAYGRLCAIGKQLGFTEGVNLLKETLEEERATDLKLTESAERDCNVKAKAA